MKSRRGATTTETSVFLLLVAAGILLALTTLGQSVDATFRGSAVAFVDNKDDSNQEQENDKNQTPKNRSTKNEAPKLSGGNGFLSNNSWLGTAGAGLLAGAAALGGASFFNRTRIQF